MDKHTLLLFIEEQMQAAVQFMQMKKDTSIKNHIATLFTIHAIVNSMDDNDKINEMYQNALEVVEDKIINRGSKYVS